MLSQCTWHLLNLTKLILLYMQKLGNFDEPIVCTSIQLSRNLESKLHVDKNNQGDSHITGVGDYEGGETFLLDGSEDAYDFYTMKNAIPRFGTEGTMLRGNIKKIKDTVSTFNASFLMEQCPSGEKIRNDLLLSRYKHV